MKFLIPFVVAYIGKKIIFHFLDFNYDPFNDPFDGGKLLIDVGVFSILWILGLVVYYFFIEKNKSIKND